MQRPSTPSTRGEQRRHPADVGQRRRRHQVLALAVPALVVGDRGPAVGGAEAPEVGVVLLRRPGAVDDHHARPGRLGPRQPEPVGPALVDAALDREAPGSRRRIAANPRSRPGPRVRMAAMAQAQPDSRSPRPRRSRGGIARLSARQHGSTPRAISRSAAATSSTSPASSAPPPMSTRPTTSAPAPAPTSARCALAASTSRSSTRARPRRSPPSTGSAARRG